NRLATGNKVNSALDNPSSFFTASALNSRAADMSNLLDSMASGIKVIEAANNGITALTKNLESMQSTLRQARQDKSFQTKSFEVNDNTKINLGGGQFGDLNADISLATATVPGVKSVLTTEASAAYLGPQSTTASATGAGARSVISLAGGFTAGDEFTVAGVDVTAGADVTAAGLAATITTALAGSASTAGKYTVSVGAAGSDNAGKIIIETVDTSAAAAAIDFDPAGAAQTATAAVKGTTEFNYSAVPGSINVAGQNIATGANFADFVDNLKAGAEAGKYTVEADAATGKIKLTNTEYGATVPTVTGIPTAVAGSASVDTIEITTGAAIGDTFKIDDETYTFTAAPGSADATAAELRAWINSNATLSAKYASSVSTDTITLTEKSGAKGFAGTGPTVAVTGTVAQTSANTTPGVTTVNGRTDTTGIVGTSVEAVAAEKATFTVSYDGKTANVSIGGVKGGVGSAVNALDIKNWQDATIASVNSDLEAKGITGVEAKFDEAGKFQLVAKNAEAKTLAVSGDDAVALFGTNGVNTGVAEKSQLNSTKTVDKFVELINRDHGGKVRASNDNGKLRIENLSTQALDIGVDTNGNDAVTALKIDGNNVRANLSKQFNELRDQLDKLGDDASFNGINLLRGDKLKITFNESGTSSIDIQAKDANGNVRGINASNLGVESLVAEDLDTDEKIDAFLTKLSSALTELRSQASAFGSNLSSVENRQSFTKNMINTLETGAANLTLADTNEEAANLLALQTRQQLSSSALSMASQQDQAVLQLLR
ncbi:flagellin, partial [Devosia sp. Leaf64]|uniref:flagellin N-terminal helical domain-containing protein n=1 Tax=Devosia sp. Leaf64 TaxID=1736229 RepID=UPI00190FD3EA